MGEFVSLTHDGNHWLPEAHGSTWLRVDIHDSDIATLTFSPSGYARGLVYLGYQPRVYFDDPAASAPVDLDLESAALAAWARDVSGVDVDPADIRVLLAGETDGDPLDDFVEETVDRLLALLGLDPLPASEE